METIKNFFIELFNKLVTFLSSFSDSPIAQILIGIIVIGVACTLLGTIAGKAMKIISTIILIVGAYVLLRGFIDFGTIQSWWNGIPSILEKIFLLGG